MITGFYVRPQVVSGPRDADPSVPSVACERLEAASDSKQKKKQKKLSSLSKCSGIRHLTSRIATKQHPVENKRSSSPSSSSPPPRPAISTSKCYMSPTRFGSRATTTTIRSDVRSSSCICVSGRQWPTASVCGASSTAAVTGAQAAEVLGTAAWTVSCPIGQHNIARSAGATSS